VGFCDGQNWRWGRFSPRTSVSPANLHSIFFSTIIFIITRGWHNRPGVAAVPVASQSRIKKNKLYLAHIKFIQSIRLSDHLSVGMEQLENRRTDFHEIEYWAF
jgi:hypothetical protein